MPDGMCGDVGGERISPLLHYILNIEIEADYWIYHS